MANEPPPRPSENEQVSDGSVGVGKKLVELEAKIDAIYKSVEKTRRYFQIIFIVTIVTFVLPLIGLAVLIPLYIGQLQSTYSGFL